MSGRLIDGKKKRANMTITFNENVCDVKSSKKQQVDEIVKSIENREKLKFSTSKRQLALALHRQADQLHKKDKRQRSHKFNESPTLNIHSSICALETKGRDYEAALVLYHRAARAHPQNTSHVVAAKKISSFILSSSSVAAKNSPKTLKITRKEKTSHSLSNLEEKIEGKRKEDSCKHEENFLRCPPQQDPRPPKVPAPHPLRSQDLTALQKTASKTLNSLKTAFASNNYPKTLEIASNLLQLSSPLLDSNYRAAAHRFSALSHLSLGRHDKALDHSLKMFESARETGDVRLQLRSLAVLGKVHLTFGHVNAAAIAWTDLLQSLQDPVPKAWLLHEIGRCHYEMGNNLKALEISRRCCNWAEEGDSNKWIYHAKLLAGQALIALARFPEALEALRCAGNVAKIEGASGVAVYVGELMERVGGAVRGALEGRGEEGGSTSRTRIIEVDKDKGINGNEGGRLDEDTCIIDKWKKWLDQSKKRGEEGKVEGKDRLYRCFMGKGDNEDD